MSNETNTECLESMSKKLLALTSTQKDTFEIEINRITKANAAKGKLRSGDTIREVADSLKGLINHRSSVILSCLRNLPFTYSESLRSDLDRVIDEYLPVDFANFRERYLELIHLAGANDIEESAGLDLVEKECHLVRETLSSGIDEHLLILKARPTSKPSSKGFLISEGLGVLATVFLAGMWVANPSGNYEPWIIIIAACTAGAELIRRRKSR